MLRLCRIANLILQDWILMPEKLSMRTNCSKKMLLYCPSEDAVPFLTSTDADAITVIYVLEHIVNVTDIFKAISENQHIKYLYLSVPILSLGSMLDVANSGVAARVIGSTHTHIYTNESINWICKNYSWGKLGEWRVGVDIADLLRNLMVKAIANGDENYAEMIKKGVCSNDGEFQAVLAKHGI